MFVTLGMSGWFIDENEKHSNIEFVFSKKSIFLMIIVILEQLNFVYKIILLKN